MGRASSSGDVLLDGWRVLLRPLLSVQIIVIDPMFNLTPGNYPFQPHRRRQAVETAEQGLPETVYWHPERY